MGHSPRPHLLNFDQRFRLPRQDQRLVPPELFPKRMPRQKSQGSVSKLGNLERDSTEPTVSDNNRSWRSAY